MNVRTALACLAATLVTTGSLASDATNLVLVLTTQKSEFVLYEPVIDVRNKEPNGPDHFGNDPKVGGYARVDDYGSR